MTDALSNILIYFASFVAIWIGSGLIVSSVNKISRKLRFPSFLISFVILGLLTSTPEIAVGLSAISSGTPAIFVGNLLGGVPVLFLLVIPLLAIFGKGIKLNHNLDSVTLAIPLLVSITPFLLVLDGHVSASEAVGLILIYIAGVYLLERNNELTNRHSKLLKMRSYSFWDIAKVLIGTAIVLVASNIIVSQTIYFSEILNIPPFYISLIILSLGTNLPELTLAVRSIITKKKDIAFGDYLGSASANTLLFGTFTLLSPSAAVDVGDFLIVTVLICIGLILFYRFSRTKNAISSKEGLILLGIYIIFVITELTK